MLNKDKRSLCLALCLGDGCFHYFKRSSGVYGGLTIDHGIEQADYQKWKAELLGTIFDREVRVRTGHKGKSVQINVCNNVFKAYRRFIYKDNKKRISRILPFIRHPELALAIWLMDDGYVEAGGKKNGKRFTAGLRIFTCDQEPEEQEIIMQWLKANFNCDSWVRYQTCNKKNKKYPFIKINSKGAFIIWEKIRSFVLQFKSMQYKFRCIESCYQRRYVTAHSNQ